MNCVNSNLLEEYLEGTLQPAERMIVEAHVKACSTCKKELSELKLLLWELNQIQKEDPQIPAEIAKVRERVLTKILEDNHDKMNLTEILNLQKKNFANASTFVKFIPGVKKGRSYLKQGLAKTPSAAFSLSCSVVKSGFKILQTGLSL